jgi:hypothetical protein
VGTGGQGAPGGLILAASVMLAVLLPGLCAALLLRRR